MTFALVLFISAANHKLGPARKGGPLFHKAAKDHCDELYVKLCGERDTCDPPTSDPDADEATLYQAFRVLCEHYDGHPDQVSLCARTLAFHFLMQRSAGAVLEAWVEAHPESDRYVLIPAAVVHAVATIRLGQELVLKDRPFLRFVEAMASEDGDAA